MLEHSHIFTLVDGTEVTFKLRNTLFEDIRERELAALGAVDGAPDGGIRANFCYIVARVHAVEGAPEGWLVPEQINSEAEFKAAYRRFARSVNDDTFISLVGAINELKAPNQNPVTKPDGALSDEERADPKSSKRGSASKTK